MTPDSITVDIADKIEKKTYEFLEETCLASIESAGVRGRLLIPDLPPQRPTINLMFMTPFGMGKSTIARDIPSDLIFICDDVTYPGLVGTITQEGQLLPGAVFNAGGKVLAVDEAQRLGPETIEGLKGLVENGHTTRTMGYLIERPPIYKNTRYLTLKPLKTRNGFTLSWRGSLWLMGEHAPPHFKGGWASRFICIELKTEIDDIRRIVKGKGMFDLSRAKGTTWGKGGRKEEDFNMPIPQYHHAICDPYMEMIESHGYFQRIRHQDYGLINRTLMNVVRLAAHYMRVGKSEDNAAARSLKYAEMLLYGAMRGQFTVNTIKVLDSVLVGFDTIAALVEKTGLCEKTIRTIIKDLNGSGMVNIDA